VVTGAVDRGASTVQAVTMDRWLNGHNRGVAVPFRVFFKLDAAA